MAVKLTDKEVITVVGEKNKFYDFNKEAVKHEAFAKDVLWAFNASRTEAKGKK